MQVSKDQFNEIAKKNLRVYVKKIIGLKNQPFHDELDNILSDSFYRNIAISFPRDHGKSTHISIAYPCWEIARNHNVRILLISATSAISKKFLTQIIGIIGKNEKYKEWARDIDPTGKGVVPQLKNDRQSIEKWASDSIIISREDLNLKDPTINAVGLFGSILSARCDICICDDIINQENSFTEDQREKIIEWIYTTVMPVIVPGGRFIYLGNTWHQTDLVSKLLSDPQMDYHKRRRAIIHESNHPELWKAWAEIIYDESIEKKERVKKADDFYAVNKVQMDDGVEVLWPDKFSYAELYLKRMANSYSFERMYQCDPSNRPNQKIKDEWINEALRKGRTYRFQSEPFKDIIPQVSCSGLDLAISEKTSSDDTALLTLDKILYGKDDIKPGDFMIRNIRRGKFSPNEVRTMLKDHAEHDRPDGIRVETVGYQESIKRDMDDMGIQVTGYHTGGEKNDPDIGVNSIAILMEQGKFIIPSDPTDNATVKLATQIANEMRSFPDGHTGDSLMALWFALSEIRDREGDMIIIPSSIATQTKEEAPKTIDEKNKVADTQVRAEQEYLRSQFQGFMRKR
jgi:hypothetical protein